MKLFVFTFLCSFVILQACQNNQPQTAVQGLDAPLYSFQNLEPRWNSFENPTLGKGAGGTENRGAKGHPYDYLRAGESKTLMEVEGPGVITRMGFTIQTRSPQMLRALKLIIKHLINL